MANVIKFFVKPVYMNVFVWPCDDVKSKNDSSTRIAIRNVEMWSLGIFMLLFVCSIDLFLNFFL